LYVEYRTGKNSKQEPCSDISDTRVENDNKGDYDVITKCDYFFELLKSNRSLCRLLNVRFKLKVNTISIRKGDQDGG